MNRFCVYGIVKNGQVVLDIPLPLADGTEVVVTDNVDSIGPEGPPEVAKRMILGLVKRLDLLDDPDWREKIANRTSVTPAETPALNTEHEWATEEERKAACEKAILAMAGMWANRPEMADPDKWVRRLWGRDE